MSRSHSLTKADPRTPNTRAVAKFIELSFAFGAMGLLWVLGAQAIGFLQAARCPTTAFASGSPNAASIFMLLGPGFAAIGLGLIASNVVTGALPATRRFFDGDPDFRKSKPYRRDQALLLRFALGLAAVGMFVSFTASHAQFCLTPNAIFNRSAPWEPMHSYPWSAVRSVTTACTPGSKGSWLTEYQLEFSDGQQLDIRDGGAGNAWKSGRQIFDALRPVHFRFDATRVEADCGAENVEMLQQHP